MLIIVNDSWDMSKKAKVSNNTPTYSRQWILLAVGVVWWAMTNVWMGAVSFCFAGTNWSQAVNSLLGMNWHCGPVIHDKCKKMNVNLYFSLIIGSLCRDALEAKWLPHTLQCKFMIPEYKVVSVGQIYYYLSVCLIVYFSIAQHLCMALLNNIGVPIDPVVRVVKST